MNRFWNVLFLLGLALIVVVPAVAVGEELVLYSGRSKTLVAPIIEQFTEQSGIAVRVRYGKTAQLALSLQEEGDRSPGDVFWAQDAGALGALAKAGLFTPLPGDLLETVSAAYRNPQGLWVATSGRARTLAYAPGRVDVDALPQSVFDLADPKYKNRVGWAPTNASFQAFVTAMRKNHGDDTALQWLRAMKVNGAHPYPKNTAIIAAIAAGEIDFGLPNHYYLIRFKNNEGEDYPVEQTSFAAGDIGNLVNVAGVGMLAQGRHHDAAERVIRFLISHEAQQYFAIVTYEYPVIEGVELDPHVFDSEQLNANRPQTDLDNLDDLEQTFAMLREAGLL